jgi:hypothetical protein
LIPYPFIFGFVQLAAHDRRREKEKLAALDTDLKAVSESTDLLARAALLAAGFHQHKRGDWRKRREQAQA